MQPPLKNSLRWFLVLFLLFVLISALRLGSAELFSMGARNSIDAWQSAKVAPTAQQIDRVARQVGIARWLAASSPEPYENRARLSMIRAALPLVSAQEKQQQLALGLAEIRSAIALRPVSPYSWALLLLLKRDAREFDAEFRHALHRTVELGPWEPELLAVVADAGLSAWDVLPATEQDIIRQVFLRGLEHQENLMRDVAKAHHDACTDRTRGCP